MRERNSSLPISPWPKPQARNARSFLPRTSLLAFIGEQPGKVGTREIARAFNLKNNDRAALKRMLRELGDEGRLERRHKKLHPAGALPSVVVADITERDRDGELIALPTEWDEEAHGAAAAHPRACAAPRAARRNRRRRRPRAAAHRGNRGRRRHPPQRPRHQDHGPRQAARARHFPPDAGRRRTAGADRQETDGQGARRSPPAPRSARRKATWSRWRSRAPAGSACRSGM